MLRITAHKIAQILPERYPGEHQELQQEHAQDEAESAQYEKYNVYFIKEIYENGLEQTLEDGHRSPEEAKQIVLSDLQDSIERGVVEIRIIHRDEGWVETVWDRNTADQMPQPMLQPMPKPMQGPFPR